MTDATMSIKLTMRDESLLFLNGKLPAKNEGKPQAVFENTCCVFVHRASISSRFFVTTLNIGFCQELSFDVLHACADS
jgi:hypothetical protein